jgi:AhpD family alkylhydroperoxidase
MIMESRLDYAQIAPGAVQAMLGLEAYVRQSGLERSLLHLIKIRASQINGCAFCLDMHTREARADGESEGRIYLLDAWREIPDYSERERAALAWTEAMTLVADGHVPDDVYKSVSPHFTEKELVDVTMAVVAINGWNRLSIGFRALPTRHQLAQQDNGRG